MSKTMTNDMTSGNPTKLIINFMIPLFLGNLFQQFYNIADSVVAGKFVGVNALAAIGSTTSLMFLVTGLLNGAGSGFAILISQWFGAKDYKSMRRYLAMSLYLMVIIVVVMTVGLSLANEPLLRLMNSPENLIGDIKSYMGVIYAGLFATGAYNMLAAVLRAVGDSKSPLYFLIISAVLCFIYILKKFPILHLKKEDFEFSGELCRRLLALGVPMALQFSITSIGTIIVQAAINVYGATCIAGFAAGGKIQSVMGVIFISYGAAMATYVGQNCGAGRMDRVKQGVRSTQIMVLIWSFILMALVLLFGKYAIYLFVDRTETDVVEAALTYFKAVAWCYPFLGSIFIYRNALQGMGYGLVPMLGGVFELVARTIIVISVAGKASYFGVCLSDPAAWIAALIPLIPYYIYLSRRLDSHWHP